MVSILKKSLLFWTVLIVGRRQRFPRSIHEPSG